MQMTVPIYRKGNMWYKSRTEVPHDVDENGNITDDVNLARYDEQIFVELYDDSFGLDISLDKLVELHKNYGWGKVASMGLKDWYVPGERIMICSWRHEMEYMSNAED